MMPITIRAWYAATTIMSAFATTFSRPAANAGECTAASGTQRVAVLELYTSEGCDSCPPADRWVSEFPARKLTGERVLPLAFHVDYWNQLGWIDPFSQSVFSDRQRQHSKRRDMSFVVTPQLLLNGRDYRRGDQGSLDHTQRFRLDARWKPRDLNLAVFVQHPQSGDVLQALVASCP